MSIDTVPPIWEVILSLIENNGGAFAGTMRLANEIPATHDGVMRSLRQCRKRRLIRSIHRHGGRGNLTVHKLTNQGRFILIRKNKDHIG
jgi:hypothetical protein